MTEELKQALRTIEHLRASPLMANHRAGLDAAHQLLSPLSQRPAAQATPEPSRRPLFAASVAARKWAELQEQGHRMQSLQFDGGPGGSGSIDPWGQVMWATPEPAGEAVASIYITPGGEREFDDWKHDLPVGRTILYTHPAPGVPDDTVPLDALHAVERERDYWKSRSKAMGDHAEGTCWCWMGDGEDHLESLVNSLPVVIRADQLRELLARPAPGVPEGFALVPVEPTQAMLDALHSSAYLPGCYRAVLAAAQAKGAGHG